MKTSTIVIGAAALLASAAAGYYWQQFHTAATPSVAVKPAETEDAEKYPVAPVQVPATDQTTQTTAKAKSTLPMPKLDESDEPIEQILEEMIGKDLFESLFRTKDIVRRFVVTVDSATNHSLAYKYSIFKPLTDTFIVSQTPDGPTLGEANFGRYDHYVDAVKAINSRKLVAVYARIYPLFQKAYRDLGMPGYFNDRMIAAIDNVLSTPDVQGVVKLQPGGYYKFADPQLESLSAAQKLLIRIGSKNAAVVKEKLGQLRGLLSHLNKR